MVELKKLFEDDYVSINANEQMRIIEFAWKKFLPFDDLKRILDMIFEFTRDHGYRKNLGDMRDLKVMPQEHQEYIQTNWFPRMMQIGLRANALINTKSVITKMSIDRLRSKMHYDGVTYQTGFFDNVSEAREWLAAI